MGQSGGRCPQGLVFLPGYFEFSLLATRLLYHLLGPTAGAGFTRRIILIELAPKGAPPPAPRASGRVARGHPLKPRPRRPAQSQSWRWFRYGTGAPLQ